jgi:hypothetical protein
MNRAPDPLIHAAPAEISDHRSIDLIVGGFWILRQQRRRRHDLSGLTISTLRHLLGDPCPLHRMCVVR